MTEYTHPIITELLPKPSTGSEWVELYNPTSTAIDLTGWTLTDQLSQPSLIYTFTATSIAPGDTLVVEVGKKLNDSGDGVTLLDVTGQSIDQTNYTSAATADLSWSRLSRSSSDFDWDDPSPGVAPPLLITPTPTKLPTPTSTLTPTPIPATSTPRPSAKPSPSPTPSQIQITPTLGPITTTALQNRLTTAAHLTSAPTKPWPSPQLNSLIATPPATISNSSTSSSSAAPTPDSHHSRQVYFPDWRSVPAIHNVIIGGLILAVYTSFLIWFDWQQSQLIEL